MDALTPLNVSLKISKLYISHTYTQNSLHFNLQFSPLVLLPLYIYLSITFYVIPCQIYIGQKRCYLPSFFSRHLPNSNIVVSSNPNPYELATTNEANLHFILSDNDNYNFDVKDKHCEFVGFVNDVIDCGCLGCIFCFRIKVKEKDTFYINFYSIIIIKSCCFFSLIQLNNYNRYVCENYNCYFL